MEKKIYTIFEEFLTLEECANILQCHVNSIRNFIERNELESIKLMGIRGFRIPVKSFEEFIIKKKYIPNVIRTETNINISVK